MSPACNQSTGLYDGELPDGSNPNDERIDTVARLIGDIAEETGCEFVNLREVFIAWLQNDNWRVRRDGSLEFRRQGMLTSDGIHPNETGNKLIAEHLLLGILRSLAEH